MKPRRSLIARILAALLIRGGQAPYVLRDLDDAFDHDVARGLPAPAVRRRDLWNILASAASLWSEALRSPAWRPSMLDVRLGVRAMIRTPGLSAVIICALAIGIPVGLAPMHAVDALERPLPGDPGGRIRTVCYWRDTVHEPATAGDYVFWRASLRSFESLAAYRPAPVHVEIGGADVPIAAIETTASAFRVLGTSPTFGRVLHDEDEAAGAPNVVVIGYDLWRAQLGGDPGILGRTLRIAGAPYEVVGVMPPGFRFPTSHQLWMPLRIRDDGRGPRTGAPLVVFGRLADGVTGDTAQAEVQALTSSLSSGAPERFDRLRGAVLPAWHLTFDFPSPGGLRALPEFSLVQLVMLVPLLVACVNVGLLVLAQTSTRATEFAVRTALGASRGRILAQVFVEFLVLSLVAAGAGLLILTWIPDVLLTRLGITLPYWMDPGLTLATVLRALVLAAGCAVLAGVLPALRITGQSIDANIKHSRANRSGGRPGGLSGVLIAIDVAVAIVAVAVAAGLWGKIEATRPNVAVDGVRAGEILSATFEVRATDRDAIARTQALLVERLRAEPAVRSVTFATSLPRMDHPVRSFELERDSASSSLLSGPFKVRTAQVAADFFDALEAPLLAGRAFDAREAGPDLRTVIVNTTFAQRAFGSTNVIGKRIRQVASDGTPAGPWLEIVGVAGRMGMHALTPSEDDGVYLPLGAGEVNPVRLAIVTHGTPAALTPRLHELARSVSPDAMISSPVPLDQMFEGDWYFLRAFVVAGVLLVVVLLSLAASALYTILSLAVTRRTREIGIRVALGADRWRIAREVASRAVVQIGAGVLLGLPAAAMLCYEFLEVTGFGGTVGGAIAMAAALGGSIMLLVAVTACTVPTLRALRIAPIDALRVEP